MQWSAEKKTPKNPFQMRAWWAYDLFISYNFFSSCLSVANRNIVVACV